MIDLFTIVHLQAGCQNIAGLKFFSSLLPNLAIPLVDEHQCGYITKLEKQNHLAP